MTMEIKIHEETYKLKYTIRALLIYEQITGKVFKLETLTDEYLFFYCILAANNPDVQLSFDELIDAIDEDFSLMFQFQSFIKKEMEKQALFTADKTDDKKKS